MANQGSVYASSNSQFAYNTQAQADALFMGWLDKCKAAGDWQSALAFLTAWDSSTGYSLPGSDENYRGYSSAAALAYRNNIGAWINSQSSVIQQAIASTQLVTGGQEAVTARAATGDAVSIVALQQAGLPIPPISVPGQSTPPVSGALPPAPSAPAGSSPATSGAPPAGPTQLTNRAPSTTLPIEGNAGATDYESTLSQAGTGFPFLPNVAKPLVIVAGVALLLFLFSGDN